MASAGGFERAVAFERGVFARSATRVEPIRFGDAVFCDPFPLSYDHNHVQVADGALDGVAPEELIAELDAVQGGPGLAHREVRMSEADGARMRPAFERAGYEVDLNLYQELAAEPDRAIDTGGVRLVEWDEIRPSIEEATRREPYADSEETIRQLVDRSQRTMQAIPTRFLVAEVDGVIASYAHLYTDGTTAQIEDVNTLKEYRGRGLAKAVVRRGSELAVQEGHDLVFLVADGDDWPQHLYRSIGFRDLGTTIWFIRQPPVPRGSD